MHNKIEKNSLINLLNRVITMSLSLGSLMIVTKRIGSENYGMISFCESIVSYFMLIASFGISDYAIRECSSIRDDKQKTSELASRLFSFNIITSLIGFCLLVVFVVILNLTKTEKIILLILGVKVAFSAFGLSWIIKIYEDYLYVALCKIITEVLLLVFLICFIHSTQDYMIYVVISTAIEIIPFFLEHIISTKYIKVRFTNKMNIKNFLFPVIVLFINLTMTTLYLNVDLTMLGFLKTNEDVGLYKLASNIYIVLLELINSFCIVSLPRISYYKQNANKKTLYDDLSRKIYSYIILMTIPVTTGVLLTSKKLIPIIFGEEYIKSAFILQIIVFSLFFGAINNFYINIILISNKKDRDIFKITIFGAIINIILNAIVIPFYGVYGAAVATIISEVIVFIISTVASRKVVEIKNNIKYYILALLISTVFIFIFKWISIFNLTETFELCLQILLCVISYILILYFIIKRQQENCKD